MAPKRFGIEFLLIHLLFLPGLPLLHQLFHHKMPQIQNRAKIWCRHWSFTHVDPLGQNMLKQQTAKTWNKLIQLKLISTCYFSFKVVSELHQQSSANIFKGRVSSLQSHQFNEIVGCLCRICQRLINSKNTPFNNRVELPFCRSTGNSVPIGCHLTGRKEYVRTSVGREIIRTHYPPAPVEQLNPPQPVLCHLGGHNSILKPGKSPLDLIGQHKASLTWTLVHVSQSCLFQLISN